jgi:hypothetical protein
MTATKGLGTYGNAAGTVTPLDHKMAQSGLIVKTAANTIRSGLFWDGSSTIVSGKANMSYDVRALSAVLSRGATAGSVLLTNDATYNVATTAAPGSNSRYDLVYLWQREYSIDGTDSNPVIGVVQGTAAASPTIPSLSAYPGAIELARILVPAGVTATNSGTTITQTAPFTATAGGVVHVRNTTERDGTTPYAASSWTEGQIIWLIDTDEFQRYDGTTWRALSPGDRVRIIPTVAVTGGSASVAADGVVTATGAVTILRTTIPSATLYREFEVTLNCQGGTVGTFTFQVCSGSSADATANSYLSNGAIVNSVGTAVTVDALFTSTSWRVYNGSRSRRRNKFTFFGLAQAVRTAWVVDGHDSDVGSNLIRPLSSGEHTLSTAYDGVRFNFSGMGTFAELEVIVNGRI